MNYIIKNNLMIIDEYVDDGISGTQFDRDGFEKHCTNYINYFFFHDIPPRYKQKLDTFVPSFLLITNTLVRLNSNDTILKAIPNFLCLHFSLIIYY